MDISTLISNSVKIIEENLKNIVSIVEVSEKLDVSLNYLNRNFKRVVGYTPLDYLKMRKITQGIKQGIKGRGNIIDIAFEYGFNSHEVFIRSCKRYFNRSPREIFKDKDWEGFRKLDDKTLWFYLNRDKIIKKKVKLPKLVLKESEKGDFTVYYNNKVFYGIKSQLEWDSLSSYKLIPQGVYISFVIMENILFQEVIAFLKSTYYDSVVIHIKKRNSSIFYVKHQ